MADTKYFTGKTEGGFEFALRDNILDSWEACERLCDFFETPSKANLVKVKKELFRGAKTTWEEAAEYLRDIKGREPTVADVQELIMEIFSSGKEAKKS